MIKTSFFVETENVIVDDVLEFSATDMYDEFDASTTVDPDYINGGIHISELNGKFIVLA